MQNENEYTDASGVRYVAKEFTGGQDQCYGCTHDEDPDVDPSDCINAPPCEKAKRKDGRFIVWVKAEEVTA